MLAVFVLILALCLQLCESSVQNSQLRKRNLNAKAASSGHEAVFHQQASEAKEEIESVVPAQSNGYFDYFIPGIFSSSTDQKQEIKAPVDDSKRVKLATCTISGYQAVLIAPALLENLGMLESNSKRIKNIQIVMAAVKMRSLVPDQVINLSKKTPFVYKATKDCSELILPTTDTYIVGSITFLLNSVDRREDRADILNQVNSVDFNTVTLEQFMHEKESEMARILDECAAEVCRLKVLLHSTTPTLNAKLTVGWIQTIIFKLGYLERVIKGIQDWKEAALKNTYVSSSEDIKVYRSETGFTLSKLGEILEKI